MGILFSFARFVYLNYFVYIFPTQLLSIIRDIKVGKTLDYYTVDKFFKTCMIEKSLLKGTYFEKIYYFT